MNKESKDITLNGFDVKHGIISNISSMLSAKIINILCGVVVSILLARYLGAEQQGIISHALSVYGMFSFFAIFGLPDIIIREFSQNRDDSKAVAKSAMLLMILGGIIASFFAISLAMKLNVVEHVRLFVILYSIENLTQFLRVYEQWLYSVAKTKTYSIAQIIIHIIFLLMKVIGIALNQDMIWFVVCTVLEVVITNLSLVICYRAIKEKFQGDGKITKVILKRLICSCWPLIVVGAANTIYLRIDQVMVGSMIGETDLGIYSIGVTMAEYWYFVPAIIYTSFLPFMSKKKNDELYYYQLLQKFADFQVLISYIAILCVTIAGSILVPVIYGQEYANSSYVLIIYIWAGLFLSLSYVDHISYVVCDDTIIIMIINVIAAMINVLLNVILIPMLGIYGAALATTLDYILVRILVGIIFWGKYNKEYRVQFRALFPFKRLYYYLRSS